MKKHKILIILDKNYLTLKNFIQLKYTIIDTFDEYDVVFKIFDKSKEDIINDSKYIQNDVDINSIDAQLSNYECVIVSGDATFFWINTQYYKNMIVVNPIIKLSETFIESENEGIKELENERDFNAENTICILSKELENQRELYDNAFLNTTVVVANEKIKDIEKFWSKNSTIYKIFNFIIKK